MTKEQAKVERELIDKLKKWCNGKNTNDECKECKHYNDHLDFCYDCWGKIAIDMIIALRKENASLREKK